MKVIGTGIIPQQIGTKPANKPAFGCKQDEGIDTFTKSTIDADTAKMVLENPTLFEKYNTFMRNAFLKLVQTAYGKQTEQAEDNHVETDTETTVSNDKEIERLTKRNEELKAKISLLEQENAEIKEKLHEENSKNSANNTFQGYVVDYPKKVGMSKDERNLKQLVTSILHTETAKNNIEDVVIAVHDIKDKSVRDDYITRLYNDYSENRDNMDKLEKIINDYHKELYPQEGVNAKTTETPIVDEETSVDEKQSETATKTVDPQEKGTTDPSVELFHATGDNKKISITPKGKIEIDQQEEKLRQARLARAAQKKLEAEQAQTAEETQTAENTTTETIEKPKRPRFMNNDVKKLYIDCPYVDRTSPFYFEHGKTLPSYVTNLSTEINQVIKSFKSTINPKDKNGIYQNRNIYWLERDVLKEPTNLSAIISQIKLVKENTKGKNKIYRKDHLFNNITEKNAFEFVDILSNKKFRNVFTLHSAMRFVDRYANFEYGIPTEKDCEEMVDTLSNTIHTALSNGVNYEDFVDNYTDPHKPQHGARVVIQPEYFDEKAKELFGDKPLVITFCEQKNGRGGFGAISTIYSDKEGRYRKLPEEIQ